MHDATTEPVSDAAQPAAGTRCWCGRGLAATALRRGRVRRAVFLLVVDAVAAAQGLAVPRTDRRHQRGFRLWLGRAGGKSRATFPAAQRPLVAAAARVLFGIKAGVVVIAPSAAVLMLVPAAGWQRQVSALMGIPVRPRWAICARWSSRAW
ncbi:hypothetical protein I553_5268 [Mycobacterium xenopi 4042]|uniref:Uncharacterized protein n=1 Tax=Mycobacterium xenopi 4042 TaxID=1299334 RepID=X7ZXK9_MYCXE|nr:hypothetical protein I553_5268 [Mycobacterium xenopi 4042]